MTIIYLILKPCATSQNIEIYINEIADVACADPDTKFLIEHIQIGTHSETSEHTVITALNILNLLTESYPDLTIQLLGSVQVLVTRQQKSKMKLAGLRTLFVGIICFFGAAFTIMAFENDVGTSDIFQNVYYYVTGAESDGATFLELGYSLGLLLGILYFFHHWGRKKEQSDPTPVEVSMQQYEQSVTETICQKQDS